MHFQQNPALSLTVQPLAADAGWYTNISARNQQEREGNSGRIARYSCVGGKPEPQGYARGGFIGLIG